MLKVMRSTANTAQRDAVMQDLSGGCMQNKTLLELFQLSSNARRKCSA